MRNIISQARFRTVLPLLIMAVLLTLPSTATGSKYVWEENINVTLKISYDNQSLTSVGPVGYPSEFWVQDFTNIQATPTEDGLILTVDEGYALPEYISVKIGQKTFSIRSDGTEAPEGITFDPATGLLTIAESLTDENPGGVTVQAVAVLMAVPDNGTSSSEGVSTGGEISDQVEMPISDDT